MEEKKAQLNQDIEHLDSQRLLEYFEADTKI